MAVIRVASGCASMGVEPLVGIVAAEGRQTGFDCPLGRFRPSDRF